MHSFESAGENQNKNREQECQVGQFRIQTLRRVMQKIERNLAEFNSKMIMN